MILAQELTDLTELFAGNGEVTTADVVFLEHYIVLLGPGETGFGVLIARTTYFHGHDDLGDVLRFVTGTEDPQDYVLVG